MNDLPLLDSVVHVLVVLAPAAAIAVLRVMDVTLNVFRTVFTVNGRKGLAALFHGLEGGVWLAAAGIVFADLTPLRMAGFVVGVMAGTFLGTTIIERLRLGHVTVRIYVDANEDPVAGLTVADAIHHAGFGATTFDGTGFHGPVQMVLSTVRRRDAEHVIGIARQLREDAFVAVDNERMTMPAGGRV
jgi:uncharacterized protein YebE (UPF0316 family)